MYAQCMHVDRVNDWLVVLREKNKGAMKVAHGEECLRNVSSINCEPWKKFEDTYFHYISNQSFNMYVLKNRFDWLTYIMTLKLRGSRLMSC